MLPIENKEKVQKQQRCEQVTNPKRKRKLIISDYESSNDEFEQSIGKDSKNNVKSRKHRKKILSQRRLLILSLEESKYQNFPR